jgi:hypothetical protein
MNPWTISFKLNKASNLEAHREEDDVRAYVEIGSNTLRVEGIEAESEDTARRSAESFANEFLNAVAYKHGEVLEIVPQTWSAEMINELGNKVVGVHVADSFSLRDSVRVTEKDASGNVVEVYDSDRPGKIEVKSSEAAAYYRRGCLSSDPFDQFRNFYLTGENVADQIRLLKQRAKLKEQPLLAQALAECFAQNLSSLLRAAQAVPGFAGGTDLFEDVAALLYKSHRCQINHAKARESKKVPFNPDDETAVRGGLPLMQFVARSLLDYEAAHL